MSEWTTSKPKGKKKRGGNNNKVSDCRAYNTAAGCARGDACRYAHRKEHKSPHVVVWVFDIGDWLSDYGLNLVDLLMLLSSARGNIQRIGLGGCVQFEEDLSAADVQRAKQLKSLVKNFTPIVHQSRKKKQTLLAYVCAKARVKAADWSVLQLLFGNKAAGSLGRLRLRLGASIDVFETRLRGDGRGSDVTSLWDAYWANVHENWRIELPPIVPPPQVEPEAAADDKANENNDDNDDNDDNEDDDKNNSKEESKDKEEKEQEEAKQKEKAAAAAAAATAAAAAPAAPTTPDIRGIRGGVAVPVACDESGQWWVMLGHTRETRNWAFPFSGTAARALDRDVYETVTRTWKQERLGDDALLWDSVFDVPASKVSRDSCHIEVRQNNRTSQPVHVFVFVPAKLELAGKKVDKASFYHIEPRVSLLTNTKSNWIAFHEDFEQTKCFQKIDKVAWVRWSAETGLISLEDLKAIGAVRDNATEAAGALGYGFDFDQQMLVEAARDNIEEKLKAKQC